MVDQSDLKYYKSQGVGLGGEITATQITSGTPTNLFDDVSVSESVAGDTEYRCFYLKNTHATETMKKLNFWMFKDSPDSFSKYSWALEEERYTWGPWGTYNGTSDRTDTADAAQYDLNNFTVAAWFYTTKADYTTEGAIINKGGFGSDVAGQNMNYGIWMDTSEKISAGFEEGSGTDHFVQSAATYNDGRWHWAACTYDGTTLTLYVDDATPVTAATSTTPETNAQPVTIGANSRANDRYFQGYIDEVRIYNTAWTSAQVTDYYTNQNLPDNTTRVFINKFGDSNRSRLAQTVANESTAPVNVTWNGVSNVPPSTINIGDLVPGAYRPIWVRSVIAAGADSRANDNAIFRVDGEISQGGSAGGGGSGGGGEGGGGGNPPPSSSNVTVCYTADTDCNSTTDSVFTYMAIHSPNVVLLGGDDSYGSNETCLWSRSPVKALDDNQGSTTRLETAFGNHDTESSTKINQINSHYGYSNQWFDFTVQNIYFLIFSTETSHTTSSSQYSFIQSHLQAAASNPGIKWKIAVMHRPFFGASSNHSYNENSVVQHLMPLFDQFQMDLVMCGHNHNIDRTYPVSYNSNSATSPNIEDSTAGPYTQHVGTIYHRNGTGGHDKGSSLYSLGSQPPFVKYQNSGKTAITKIAFTGTNNSTMTVSIIDINNDDILDSFVVNG